MAFTFVGLVLLQVTVVHDFIMSFSEDPQGREACDVVLPAQVYLLGAVNLHAAVHR